MASQEADSNLQWRLELKNLPILRRLGRGFSGYLYETIWGGKKYARKDFPLGSVERNRLFETEVKTLFKVDHPNIVKCFGYTVGKSSCSLLQEYVADNLQNTIQRRIDQELRKKSIGTSGSRVLDIDEIKRLLSSRFKEKEKGKKKVGSSIPDSRRTIPFEVPEAVDIISQIATGMKYLHDNEVVHGDLKPRNVLLYSESGGWKLKLADFGLPKTKKRIKLVSKRTSHVEILTWKAPECLEELLGPLTEDSDDPFTESDTDSDEEIGSSDDFLKSKLAMADVYNFGLTCSYILGGKLMYPDLSLTQLRVQRMEGFKPKLPSACPEYLKFMIGSCLESEPFSRPTFSTICTMKDVLPHLSLPQLTDLMEGRGKECFTKLTTLSLDNCSNLQLLLSEIGNLTTLTTLSLDDSPSLLHLPSEVGNLTTLTILSIKNCSSLKHLPNEIDMMKQISHFLQGAQNQNDSAGQVVVQNVGQLAGPRVASSSSPETVRDIGVAHDPFDQISNLQYGGMNYSQMRSSVTAMPARSEPNVQRSLQSLVEKLDWTYVALWSLNHQTGNLGWKGGHFRVNSTAVTGGHGMDDEQLFDSTYKSCHFTRNLGFVGAAHAEGRNIWMNGPSVIKHAGSKEQADFLQHARIATALCIPWADGVLELGTCESVPENLELMENIRQFVLKCIVPALGQPSSHNSLIGVSQAPPSFPLSSLTPRSMTQRHAPFSSLNPLSSHMSENLSSSNFEPNSLNQRIRRTASLSSLNTDMFLQQPEDDAIQTAISLMLADGEDQEQWRSMYSPLETGNMSQMNLLESSTNGNHNISSFNTHVVGNGTQAQTTTTSMGVRTQGPFKSWRHTRILAPILQKNDRTNQELLRRCIDMMRRIPDMQRGAQNQNDSAGQAEVQSVGQQGPRVSSCCSPEAVPDIGIPYTPFAQPGPPRVQRRPRGESRIASMCSVHTGHDEAAMNHMMAERRRRVKQKENFTALRRLVPIISKADKASILGDAIVYLKDLEASIVEAQRRFETLQVSYKDVEQRNKELEQRNKELEAMVGSSASMQQRGSTSIKELEVSRDEGQRHFETLPVFYKELDQRNKLLLGTIMLSICTVLKDEETVQGPP